MRGRRSGHGLPVGAHLTQSGSCPVGIGIYSEGTGWGRGPSRFLLNGMGKGNHWHRRWNSEGENPTPFWKVLLK